MVATECPKCGYVRQSSDMAPEYECPGCGRVYARMALAPAGLPGAAFKAARKGKTKPRLGVAMVAASCGLAGWVICQMAGALAADGVAPYKCVWGNGAFSYQDEPCGKGPAPSSRFYDAKGRAIAESPPVPAAPPPDRIVAPTGLPALCKIPRAKAEAHLLAELTRRFPTSEALRAELLRSNMRDFDAICATPGPPNVIQAIDELARMHYPYFTLIVDTMHSYARAAREARQ